MKREHQAGRIWLPVLAVFCMLIFSVTDVKAAGSILTSSDGQWDYELKDDSGVTSAVVDDYNGKERDLVIPEKIDGYTVKYIGQRGGWHSVNTNRFDSITIPDSVVGSFNVPFFTHSHNLKFLSLGKNYGTYKLVRDVNVIGNDNTYDIQAAEYRVSPENSVLAAVDGVLYTKDMKKLMSYPVLKKDTSFTVPNGVVSIDSYAMNNLQYLERLVLPQGLTEIGAYCCRGASITSVSFPDSLTKLDSGIFYQSKLKSITIPSTIMEIGGYVFTGTPLEEIVIPDTVVSLGAGVFMNCESLKRVVIGSGLKSIGGNCFYGLTSLQTFEISENNPNFKSDAGMLLSADGSTLIQYAAAGSTEFTLPKGVTEIGPSACYGMPFTKIVIPDRVVSIGDNAFEDCKNAETAYIPSSVTALGSAVFSGCTSLKSVTIDAAVTAIESIFGGCIALAEITLPETASSVKDSIFSGDSLRSVYLRAPKAPSVSYTYYMQGQDAETELIKKSSGVRIFVPEGAQGYDARPWSRMNVVYGNTVTAERLTLNPSSVILNVGETASIQTAVSPEDAVVQGIVWKTSNEKVVSVDQNGRISALSAGTAYISASAGGLSAECIVTVRGGQGQASALNFRVQTSGGTTSSNYNAQNYIRWTKPMKSYLFADGGYLTRVEFMDGSLIHETYDMNGTLQNSGSVTAELPLAGGFYVSGAYRFAVYGQSNNTKSDSTEVVRIVKYDQNWNRVSSCSLYGENTSVPFDAGSLRFAEHNGILYIRTAHEMYSGHQSNLQIAVDLSSMKIKDKFSQTANIDWGGYVSHSFNQFVRMDGEDLIALDHGDAHPRAAVLIKYPNISNTTFAGSSVEHINVLTFPGMAGDNTTGASLGGLEVSENYYIFAGNYNKGSSSAARNIFVNITGKDFLQNQNSRMVYLTDFGAGSSVTVSTPQLVKVNETTFLVLWNETDSAGTTVHSQLIDENGNKVTNEQTFQGSLSDCQPILYNGQAVWYYTGLTGTKKGNTAPVFCRIAVDGRETVDNNPTGTGPSGNPAEEKKTISSHNVSLARTAYTYDGKAKTPFATVRYGTKTLLEDIDYTVTYSNNINVGTAKAVITGKGEYTGTVIKEFEIKEAGISEPEPEPEPEPDPAPGPEPEEKDLFDCTITLSQTFYTYDGEAKRPTVIVEDGDAVLEEGIDYTVTYRNNIDAGTAEAIVTGTGDYEGGITRSFTITIEKGSNYTAGSFQYKVTGTSAVSMIGIDNNVTKAVIPKTVEIGGKTFKVTAIGSSAFKGNTKITSVEIGKNVKTIGASAFKNCKKLKNITIKSSSLKKVGKNALKGIKATAKVKVSGKNLSAYKALFKNKGQGKKVKIVMI